MCSSDQDNTLISDSGHATLCDFGSVNIGSLNARNLELLPYSGQGTLQYMAPELINSGKSSKETDVWAFGVLMSVRSVACRIPVG